MNDEATVDLDFKATERGLTLKDEWECVEWAVEITFAGRTMHTPFYMGVGLLDGDGYPQAPTLETVMESLVLDYVTQDTKFEDWACDYGCDEDSRKAEATFRDVRPQSEQLEWLLGDDFRAVYEDPRFGGEY